MRAPPCNLLVFRHDKHLNELRVHDLTLMVGMSESIVHLLKEMVEGILRIGGDGQLSSDVDFVVFHNGQSKINFLYNVQPKN